MNSVKYVVSSSRKQQLYVQCFQEKFTSSSQAFLYFTKKTILYQEVQKSLSLSERVFESVLPFLTQKVSL
jgi:hypothetical protein